MSITRRKSLGLLAGAAVLPASAPSVAEALPDAQTQRLAAARALAELAKTCGPLPLNLAAFHEEQCRLSGVDPNDPRYKKLPKEGELPNAVRVGEFMILDFPGEYRAVLTTMGFREMAVVGLDSGNPKDVERYITRWGDCGLSWLWDRERGVLGIWDGEDIRYRELANNVARAAEAFRKIGGDPMEVIA